MWARAGLSLPEPSGSSKGFWCCFWRLSSVAVVRDDEADRGRERSCSIMGCAAVLQRHNRRPFATRLASIQIRSVLSYCDSAINKDVGDGAVSGKLHENEAISGLPVFRSFF